MLAKAAACFPNADIRTLKIAFHHLGLDSYPLNVSRRHVHFQITSRLFVPHFCPSLMYLIFCLPPYRPPIPVSRELLPLKNLLDEAQHIVFTSAFSTVLQKNQGAFPGWKGPLTSKIYIRAVRSPLQKGGCAVSRATHRPARHEGIPLQAPRLGDDLFSCILHQLRHSPPPKKSRALPGWKGPLTSKIRIRAVRSPLQKGGCAVSRVTHRPARHEGIPL
jgi:hypothetical protein